MANRLNIKDLRIGNYVKTVWEDSETGEEKSIDTQISGLDINGELGEGWSFMVELSDPEQDWFDSIEGIPLDKEWLIKFGCNEPEAHDDYGGMLYSFGDGQGSIRIKDGSWDCTYTKIELKYVHQFQNFIHAMTGKDPVLS